MKIAMAWAANAWPRRSREIIFPTADNFRPPVIFYPSDLTICIIWVSPLTE